MNVIRLFEDKTTDEKFNWKLKRTVLNIIWGVINVAALAFATTLIIGSGYELIWVAALIMYGSCYWILATLLFDALVGDDS